MNLEGLVMESHLGEIGKGGKCDKDSSEGCLTCRYMAPKGLSCIRGDASGDIIGEVMGEA
jgi:hypothetical protein